MAHAVRQVEVRPTEEVVLTLTPSEAATLESFLRTSDLRNRLSETSARLIAIAYALRSAEVEEVGCPVCPPHLRGVPHS